MVPTLFTWTSWHVDVEFLLVHCVRWTTEVCLHCSSSSMSGHTTWCLAYLSYSEVPVKTAVSNLDLNIN